MQSIGLKSKKILGISVSTSPKKEILEEIQKYLEKSPDKPLVITTPNPEQIVLAQGDPLFAKILNQADVSLPDGIGLAFVIKQKRIPGVEFMEDLVKLAAKRAYPVGLIGGRAGVAVEALECLKRKYPELRGWAFEPGDVDLGNVGNLGDIVEKIEKINTKIVFVGLGAPKQEEFILRLALSLRGVIDEAIPPSGIATPSERSRDDKGQGVVFMSVGGAFDMIAGRVRRAPLVVRGMGLEWLWRLCREPWRFRRQRALFKFLWLVLRAKLA